MHQPALPLRDDTFLGVCEGLGEDLRIPSNWLRVAFAALLFWNPTAAAATYAAAGVLVLFSRLVFPRPKTAPATEAAPAPAEPQPAPESAEAEPVPLAA